MDQPVTTATLSELRPIFGVPLTMRALLIAFIMVAVQDAFAQRSAPDQNPYWARYAFVEDTTVLVPLQGEYRVYYIQSGMWWNMFSLDHPVTPTPEEEVHLQRLFGPGYPALQATPARGRDLPDVKVLAIRGADTMIVELSVHYQRRGSEVDERCANMDCRRRPPFVLPFRHGRYLANGHAFKKEYILAEDPENLDDERTAVLTTQFDALWTKAMKEDHVLPQVNTDTCRYTVDVAADLDMPDSTHRRSTDVWLLRSPYCATHLAHFPAWGTETKYTIEGGPGSGVDTSGQEAVLHSIGKRAEQLSLDVTSWPPGDYSVTLVACSNGGSFLLKLR